MQVYKCTKCGRMLKQEEIIIENTDVPEETIHNCPTCVAEGHIETIREADICRDAILPYN